MGASTQAPSGFSRGFDGVIQRVWLQSNLGTRHRRGRRLSELVEGGDFQLGGVCSMESDRSFQLSDQPRVLSDGDDAVTPIPGCFRLKPGRLFFGHDLEQHPLRRGQRLRIQADYENMSNVARDVQRDFGQRDLTRRREVSTGSLNRGRVDRQDSTSPIELQFLSATGHRFRLVVDEPRQRLQFCGTMSLGTGRKERDVGSADEVDQRIDPLPGLDGCTARNVLQSQLIEGRVLRKRSPLQVEQIINGKFHVGHARRRF